ncbi:hypothetical protein CSW63_07695 [Caulobacter sp. FWC26]|jgi:hypothetical protein|nr:hypothetical protein CSW63_07695 [Caulobacter sp. FWC26]
MSMFSKPFPLDGGRVGMGVIAASASKLINAPFAPLGPNLNSTELTPIPGPSPIEGEGRGALP